MGILHPIDIIRKFGIVMSLRQLSTRIELSFWQIVIGLLSGSKPLQKLIQWFYLDFMPAIRVHFQNIDSQRFIRMAVVGLGFGLIAGFLISTF
jgi:hypothetical protein